jgi:hypothetical protein
VPSAFHKLGATQALQALGLRPSEDHTVRNVAIGAAAASPFLGLIGEQPLRHDPILNPNIPRQSLEELAAKARPGDLMLTSQEGQSFLKRIQTMGQGSEFHHIVPTITGPEGTPLRGLVDNWQLYSAARKGKLPPEALAGDPFALHNLRGEFPELSKGLAEKYPNAVLLRPTTPLNPAEIGGMEQEMIHKSMEPYQARRAIRNWFRDIFLPKIKGVTGHKPIFCPPGSNICSTIPAEALENVGREVVPGKAPTHVLPADFAKSTGYEAIGAHVNKGFLSPAKLKALRYGSRAGLGLGLGGAVYGLAKLIEKYRDQS